MIKNVVTSPISGKKKEQPSPKMHCASCEHLQAADSRCPVFKRHVEPSYNRCFAHTCYAQNPIKVQDWGNTVQPTGGLVDISA